MVNFRPLGLVKEILDSIGVEITYAYDDLVFVQHTAFLLQFDDEATNNLKLYFNVECEPDTAKKLESQLVKAAGAKEFTVTKSGKFELEQKEGVEEFDVKFYA